MTRPIVPYSDTEWFVPSNTVTGAYYLVELDPGSDLTCSCQGDEYRRARDGITRKPCRHLERLNEELAEKARTA